MSDYEEADDQHYFSLDRVFHDYKPNVFYVSHGVIFTQQTPCLEILGGNTPCVVINYGEDHQVQHVIEIALKDGKCHVTVLDDWKHNPAIVKHVKAGERT